MNRIKQRRDAVAAWLRGPNARRIAPRSHAPAGSALSLVDGDGIDVGWNRPGVMVGRRVQCQH